MIDVTVTIDVRPAALGEFLGLLSRHVLLSRREPGCLRFEMLRSEVDGHRFCLLERWRDYQALVDHCGTPHYRHWRERIGAMQRHERLHAEWSPLPLPADKVAADAFALLRMLDERSGPLVLANGVFDLLHPGHVHTLAWARRQGALLVVALDSDQGARRLKGPGRPVQCLAERQLAVAALDCVDLVVGFESEALEGLIELLGPDVLVKGPDYAGREAELPGAGLVERVAIAPPSAYALHTSDLVAAGRG